MNENLPDETNGESCADCRYFLPRPGAIILNGDQPHGVCRRFPPTLFGFVAPAPDGRSLNVNERASYPTVRRSFWCGEYIRARSYDQPLTDAPVSPLRDGPA
jgi:hypothetical protein